MSESKKNGRPLLFETVDALQKRIDEYFKWAEDNGKPYSIANLALYLDVDRQTIYNYESYDNFFDTIKRAREKCIAYLENLMILEGKAGQIFVAKNYGYTDRQEIVANNTNQNIEMSAEDAKKYLEDLAKELKKS